MIDQTKILGPWEEWRGIGRKEGLGGQLFRYSILPYAFTVAQIGEWYEGWGENTFNGWKIYIPGSGTRNTIYTSEEAAIQASDDALINIGYTLLNESQMKAFELLR